MTVCGRLCSEQEPGSQPAAFQPGPEQQPYAHVPDVLPGADAAPGPVVWHQSAAGQCCADLAVPQHLSDPAIPAGAAT